MVVVVYWAGAGKGAGREDSLKKRLPVGANCFTFRKVKKPLPAEL